MPVLKYWDGAQYVPIGAAPPQGSYGFRNKIINGAFAVNQRGITSSTSSYNFTADRWRGFYTGGTTTHSIQVAPTGDLPESAAWYLRAVTTGTAAAGDHSRTRQLIENARTLSGKVVTVSFWARAATGTPSMSVALVQNFGSGGSTAVGTLIGKVVLSTTWTRYFVTGTLPSVAGKSISGTDSALMLDFWYSAGATFNTDTGSLGIQNATIDIWGVQVEEGSVATPFEQKSFAQEFQDCRRYFERRDFPINGGGDIVLGICHTGGSPGYGRLQWMTQKRDLPTISFPYNGAARWVTTLAVNVNQTLTAGGAGSKGDITGTILLTSGSFSPCSGWLDNFVIDASAEL